MELAGRFFTKTLIRFHFVCSSSQNLHTFFCFDTPNLQLNIYHRDLNNIRKISIRNDSTEHAQLSSNVSNSSMLPTCSKCSQSLFKSLLTITSIADLPCFLHALRIFTI